MSRGTTAISLTLFDVSLRHLGLFGTVMLATHLLIAVQTVSPVSLPQFQHSDSGMLITRDTLNARSHKDAYIYTLLFKTHHYSSCFLPISRLSACLASVTRLLPGSWGLGRFPRLARLCFMRDYISSLCNSFACESFSAQPPSFKSWCYLTGFVMSSSYNPENVAGIE